MTENDPLAAIRPLRLEEYAHELRRDGLRVLAGSRCTYWRQNETGVMTRLPAFDLSMPSEREISRVWFKGPSIVGSYILPPLTDILSIRGGINVTLKTIVLKLFKGPPGVTSDGR